MKATALPALGGWAGAVLSVLLAAGCGRRLPIEGARCPCPEAFRCDLAAGVCVLADSDGGQEGGQEATERPDAMTEAGPPAVTCSAGLSPCGRMCVDLASDRNHCGACDIGCGGTCSGRICQLSPEVVASNRANDTGICDLRVVGDFLYFNEPRGLWRVPKSGGTAVALARTADDEQVTAGLAASTTAIYWVTGSSPTRLGTMRRTPLVDGPTTIKSGDYRFPFGAPSDPSEGGIYYYSGVATGFDVAIRRLDGTTVASVCCGYQLSSEHELDPGRLCKRARYPFFVDANNVYLVKRASPLLRVDELWQVPLSGAPPIRLTTGRSDPLPGPTALLDIAAVVADDSHIYLGGDLDKPRRVPIGQWDAPVEYLDQPSDPQRSVLQLLVDDTHIYWVTGDCGSAIRRQSKNLASAPAVVIHEAPGGCIKDLVSDGMTLYWSQGPLARDPSPDDEILMLPK